MSEALRYLTDETGKKTAVVLPIPDYEKLLEDLDDLAAVAERREEPTIPHEEFKAELRTDTCDETSEAVLPRQEEVNRQRAYLDTTNAG